MTRIWTILGTMAMTLALAVMMTPTLASAGDAEKGKTSYTTFCVSCHGEKGDGNGPIGATLPDPKPRDFTTGTYVLDTDKDGATGTDTDLINVIKNGAAPYGGNAMMSPWGHLSDEDIANIVAYLRTFKK